MIMISTKALQSAFMPMIPVSSLENYIHYANKIPMLSQEEELALAKRLFEEGDLSAAKLLILPHLRYVIKIAKGYTGYGLALADLIQEGNIGLMKAVKRFDPSVGVRLVSFAVHWIKAEIHEFILKNWRIVKVATTKAQRKLFFNLRKMKTRLGWMNKQEVEEVANDLGVKPEVVVQMEARLNATDAAFDGHPDDSQPSGYENDFAPSQYLEDNSFSPERLVMEERSEVSDREALFNAISTLDDRSKEILTARWLANEKATLHDLAAKLKVSAERIRQIEKAAFDKIKLALA
jgi:RNA polymerase sigma-32 factor